ncbi:MAG: biotin--[acetyl-CoA-carboxylase] ligase [Campylobacterales bacterium]|nr:biotin--[acetyl-CoA-carboxylase] ligase [Campylobacterales bacterium]
MEILWLDEIDSTQGYLLDALKNKRLKSPVCVGATIQSDGRGSRGNSWIGEEGNLFISFAIERSSLPNDLKLESSSIYFAYILKEILEDLGSKIWLKWPNDFYLGEQKLGGLITNLVGDSLICGVGINLKNAPETFATIDVEISPEELSNLYMMHLKCFPSWKQIFSKFQLEFERSKSFSTHSNNTTIELNDAVLCEDGSLECNGQRIYSLR